MKKVIIIIVSLLVLVGAGIFYINMDNSKYLFEAYLDNNTLVIQKYSNKLSNKEWKVQKSENTDEHIDLMPWSLDNRKDKITKVVIKDKLELSSIAFMFYGLNNLIEVEGLNNLSSSSLDNMAGLFYGCKSLKEIDLSSFNTSKVKSIAGMFAECENLKTIYVSNNWDVTNVEYSDNMFLNCEKLVGSNGTKYNEYIVDKTFAKVDDLDNVGYLSLKN